MNAGVRRGGGCGWFEGRFSLTLGSLSSGAIKLKASPSKNMRSCIMPKCADRPERGPTCANRARKEGSPGHVGGTRAPRSRPEARGLADLPDIPHHCGGKHHLHRTMDGWLGLSGVGWLTGCPEPAIRKLIPVTTAQRTGQSRVAVTQPLSPSHKARPPLTNATRSIEPPKSSSWSEGGDDAAALQLQQPLSRRPQPLQSAHSQRASDEPPGASASQSSSASYASPRLPCGPLAFTSGT